MWKCYILTCSLNSLVLHIVLHITSTKSFWHYCYRSLTIPFHKLCLPSVVTNSPQILCFILYQSSSIVIEVQTLLFSCIACWNLNSSVMCDTMVSFKSANAGANKVHELIRRYKTLLNQACTWFLKIDPVQIIGMHVCIHFLHYYSINITVSL